MKPGCHAPPWNDCASLPRLKKLDLRRIDITAADVDALRAALPPVTINWTPLTDDERTKLDAFLKP
jgi:hypothetical protein